MIEEIKTAIIILIIFVIILGVSNIIMKEAEDTKKQREREILYRSDMKNLRKNNSPHAYNKYPAYKRTKKIP